MKEVKVIIGADLVPTMSNIEKFSEGDTDYLFGKELMERLDNADAKIFNLETPIVDRERPIKKCGPNLITTPNVMKGIKALNISCVTLANNHILDQGIEGLESTVKLLEENNIEHIGAGSNKNEASIPWIIEIKGMAIGVYACAEHEFTIANEDSHGANPFDTLESYKHVSDLKEKCDFVIVLYHGGKEYYRYPSPNLQKFCRKFVESGADLVVCQHSHCIGCKEDYKAGTIVYGQGNFLFDASEQECWLTSVLLEVTFCDKRMSIEYIPLHKLADRVRFAEEKLAKKIIDEFLLRSREILKNGFIQEKYEQYAQEQLYNILTRVDFLSNTFFFRAFNKLSHNRLKSWYFENVYLPRMDVSVVNTLECEAWNELLLTGLKKNKEMD